MRLLADQDVYALTVRFLRDSGHDVVTAAESGLSKSADVELLQFARNGKRLFLTRDRDFGGLVQVQEYDSRAFYLRGPQRALDAMHAELESVLRLHEAGEIVHAFVMVEAGRHRVLTTRVQWKSVKRKGITNGSGVRFGRPCVLGTRIPTRSVVRLVRQGVVPVDMCRDYYPELSPEDVQACVHDEWKRWPVYFFRGLGSWIRRNIDAEFALVAWTDEVGIWRRWQDGEVASVITWDDLCSIDIETTDGGPLLEDFTLILGHRDGLFSRLPNEFRGFEEILNRLIPLPGFDQETFGRAYGSVKNASFHCWKRTQADSPREPADQPDSDVL